MILFKVALAWLAIAHHQLCLASQANHCDSFQVALVWLAVAHHQFCLASQANHCDSFQGYYARSARLVLLIINSVLLRKPIIVIQQKRFVFTNRLDTVIKIIRCNT